MGRLTKILFHSSPRSLLLAVIVLHVVIVIGTDLIGRARITSFVQPDGIILPVAADGTEYVCNAELLANLLRKGDLNLWYRYDLPLNTKIYSISFALLSPVVGMRVLAGSPVNLLLHIAILILMFKIGSTVFDQQVGRITALILALWPSFLLHVTQLLKEQFFIAAVLVIVLIMLRWLTKPSPSVVNSLLLGVAGAGCAYIIGRTRTGYWSALLAVFGVIAIAFLIFRQLRDKQVLAGHMVTSVLILTSLIGVFAMAPNRVTFKVRPSPTNPATAPQSKTDPPEPASSLTLKRRLDLTAVRIWQLRYDYVRAEGPAGTLDSGVVFASAFQLVLYLPRATMIGLFAPFPNQWSAEGRQTGKFGRRVAALEMLVAYIVEALAAFAIWRNRRNLGVWLLASIALTGVTTVALIVMNMGALFRMRYCFFILMLPLAVQGLLTMLPLNKSSREL